MSRRTTGNGNGQSGEHHEAKEPSPNAGIAPPEAIARALRKLAKAFSAGLSVSIRQAASADTIELQCTDTQRATLLNNSNTKIFAETDGIKVNIRRVFPHKKRSTQSQGDDLSELPQKRQPVVVEDVTDKLRTRPNQQQKRSRPRHDTSNKKTPDKNGQEDDAGGRPGKKRRKQPKGF